MQQKVFTALRIHETPEYGSEARDNRLEQADNMTVQREHVPWTGPTATTRHDGFDLHCDYAHDDMYGFFV